MQHIVNLTQHEVTEDQYKDGVFDVDQFDKYLVRKYLTFDEIPTVEEMEERAFWMAKIAYKYSCPILSGNLKNWELRLCTPSQSGFLLIVSVNPARL